MQLPQFGFNDAFERLRKAMGATEIVEVGEPEWSDWNGFGIDVGDISEVKANPDGTLSFRGRRVLVYIRDQFLGKDDQLRHYRYHVAECRTLETMRQQERFGRYVVTTRTDRQFVVNLFRRGETAPVKPNEEREMEVCKNCLTTLDWESYTTLSGKAKTRCWREFEPGRFLDKYGSRVKGLPAHSPETAPLNQYPNDWNEISLAVRVKSRWRCQKCGRSLAAPGARRWLHVHHRDGNRANCAPGNLEALCLGCHQREFGHEQLSSSPDWAQFQRWLRNPD